MDASSKILSEILEFYQYKVSHNLCTMEEINSAINALENEMTVNGTIEDFANFYGQSKDAVNSVIKRRMIQKPKRNVVLYPFHAFRRLVPERWRKSKSESSD